MGWNYRVMRHTNMDQEGQINESLAIHEVYYKEDLTDDISVSADETGYSEMPVAPVAENIDGLRFVLTEMLGALDKPILEYS